MVLRRLVSAALLRTFREDLAKPTEFFLLSDELPLFWLSVCGHVF